MVMPEKSRRPEASAKKRTPLHLLPALSPFRGRREDAPRPQASLRQELQAAVRTARNGWLFLISLCVIIIVTTAGISHVDLLLNRPVKLPIVQVGMPVSAYFLFTPLFLLAVHAEVLLRHVDVARKVRLLLESGAAAECHALPQYHVLSELACTAPVQKWIFRALHITTLVLLPLFTLLYLQSTYLPLHDAKLTWWHRALIILDAVFLWLYLHSLYGQTTPKSAVLAFFIMVPPSFFAVFVATIPDERVEQIICGENGLLNSLKWFCVPVPYGVLDLNGTHRKAFRLTALLYEGDVNDATGRLNSLLARNLVILNHDLAGKDANAPRLNLRNRDLRYANFSGSNLRRADFTASNMTGAKLIRADLRDALFGCARTGTPASLLPRRQPKKSTPEDEICSSWKFEHEQEKCTSLKKADLSYADLRGSTIGDAYLERATLVGSQLQGQKFNNTCLFLANLMEADLSKSTFVNSILVGSFMRKANLVKAKFLYSDLSMSNLEEANLQSTSFKNQELTQAFIKVYDYDQKTRKIEYNATLFASILDRADLRCIDFSNTPILASSLYKAKVWHTIPPKDHSASLNLPPREQGGLEFSIVKDIQIEPEGAICASSRNTKEITQLEKWWIKASQKLSREPSNWQQYVAEALCYNYTYLIAFPKRMNIMNMGWNQRFYDFTDSYLFIVTSHEIIRPKEDQRIAGDTELIYIINEANKLARITLNYIKRKIFNVNIKEKEESRPHNKKDIKFDTHKDYKPPYINPIVIWERIQKGNCPAAKKLTKTQMQKLKRWAEEKKKWDAKQREKQGPK